MRLRIISNKNKDIGHFIKIIDTRTEEILEDVVSIRWECTSPTHRPIAIIEIVDVEVDVIGETDVKKLII